MPYSLHPARACAIALLALLPAASLTARAADPVVEVELVHELGSDKGEQLAKLVERFNTDNKGMHITVSDRAWSKGKRPALMILESESEAQLLAKPGSIKALADVMAEAHETLQTLPVPRMMTPSPLDAKGKPLALPVGLAAPVMYIDKKGFERAGVNTSQLPRTWQDWQDVMGKLVAYGFTCPYTSSEPVSIFIENTSTWNNQPLVVGSGKSEQFAINGLMQVKHIAFLNSWVRGRYMHYFGRNHEAEAEFTQGKCLALTAPSSAFPTLRRQAQFEILVAPLPYHEGAYGAPQNTIADGPAMWISSGLSAAQYKTIAHFVSFWLTPEAQLQWQLDAGYLPLNQAGLLAATTSRLLEDRLVASKVAIESLINKPVSATSGATALTHRAGARRIIAEELETVWAERKPAKQALDDAQRRLRALR